MKTVGGGNALLSASRFRPRIGAVATGRLPVDSTVSRVRHSVTVAAIESIESEATNELLSYLAFDRGWDGYRGEPFNSDVIEQAFYVVRMIASFFKDAGAVPEEITPGPASDGSVDVEIVYDGKRVIINSEPNCDTVSVYESAPDRRSERRERLGADLLERLGDWFLSQASIQIAVGGNSLSS